MGPALSYRTPAQPTERAPRIPELRPYVQKKLRTPEGGNVTVTVPVARTPQFTSRCWLGMLKLWILLPSFFRSMVSRAPGLP
jgi:hypothetical protein